MGRRRGVIEDLSTEAPRGNLQPLRYLGYNEESMTSIWECRCIKCGEIQPLTRRRWRKLRINGCRACGSTDRRTFGNRVTQEQINAIYGLTMAQKQVFVLIMLDRVPNKTNVAEALEEAKNFRARNSKQYFTSQLELSPGTPQTPTGHLSRLWRHGAKLKGAEL